MDNQQLQIGFLLLVGNRLYSERELATRLSEVDRAINDGNVIDVETPFGSLSIQYLGEELWPPELCTEINNIPVAINELALGNETKGVLESQYASLRLKPMGDQLLYHLKSTPPSSEHEIIRVLPFETFLRELVLNGTRVNKFTSYLRRKPFKGIDWYFEQATPELRRIVGDERMQALAEQDLVEMLASSPCTQGYYSHEVPTFVKVPFGAPNPLYPL
ncbi:MAG TPA: hypothetical protein P5121_15010 [Caldilineaceae bacterium]|mgnify:CR=1 FL=1|nr:hypothetical protein [Caldilineaceae bacterium]